MDTIIPVYTKNFPGDPEELNEVPGADEETKSRFTLTIPWNLAKLVKNYHVITERQTPHRSQTNGIAERAVRRVKEGTSAVLLQSDLDTERWKDSMECYCYLRNIQDSHL